MNKIKIGEIPGLRERLADAINKNLLPKDILDKDINDIIELPDNVRLITGHAYNGAAGELPKRRMTLLIWAIEQERDDIVTIIKPLSDLTKRIPYFWAETIQTMKGFKIDPTTLHLLPRRGGRYLQEEYAYTDDEQISVFDYLITFYYSSTGFPRFSLYHRI